MNVCMCVYVSDCIFMCVNVGVYMYVFIPLCV